MGSKLFAIPPLFKFFGDCKLLPSRMNKENDCSWVLQGKVLLTES